MIEVLVIGGAAGSGKSSVAYELSHQLQADGVGHAVVDTDALDMVFPVPHDLPRVTERNLAAVWASFDELGVARLIVTGVYLHRPSEVVSIRRAVPGAAVTLVRLEASEATLRARVQAREIGSARAAQLERTLRQMTELDTADPDVTAVRTDSRPVEAVAADIRLIAGWAE